MVLSRGGGQGYFMMALITGTLVVCGALGATMKWPKPTFTLKSIRVGKPKRAFRISPFPHLRGSGHACWHLLSTNTINTLSCEHEWAPFVYEALSREAAKAAGVQIQSLEALTAIEVKGIVNKVLLMVDSVHLRPYIHRRKAQRGGSRANQGL